MKGLLCLCGDVGNSFVSMKSHTKSNDGWNGARTTQSVWNKSLRFTFIFHFMVCLRVRVIKEACRYVSPSTATWCASSTVTWRLTWTRLCSALMSLSTSWRHKTLTSVTLHRSWTTSQWTTHANTHSYALWLPIIWTSLCELRLRPFHAGWSFGSATWTSVLQIMACTSCAHASMADASICCGTKTRWCSETSTLTRPLHVLSP